MSEYRVVTGISESVYFLLRSVLRVSHQELVPIMWYIGDSEFFKGMSLLAL